MAVNELEQAFADVSASGEIPDLKPGALPLDPMEQAFESQKEAQKSSIQQAMFVGTKANPDRAARVQSLAREKNLPASFVDRHFDTLSQKQAAANLDLEGLIQKNPELAKWLENPDNAAVGHDDIDGLKKVERTVQDYGFGESLASDLRSGFNSAAARAAKIPGFLADAVIRKKTLGLFSTEDLGVENRPAQYFEGEAKKFATPNQQIDVMDSISKGDYQSAGKGLASQIAANAPTTAAIVVASFLGGPAAGGMLAGGGAAAEKYEENLEKGVLPSRALGNALATGSIELAAENLPFGTLGVLKRQANAFTARFGKEVTREVLKETFLQMGKSAAQEGAEEAITSVAQDLTDYVMDVNPEALEGILGRAGNSFLVGAGSGGLVTGPAAVGAGMKRSHDIRKANRARDFYLAMGESLEATKLRQRLPEAQRAFVEQVTKGSGVEHLYIPVDAWESYFQGAGENPVAAAQSLGITKELEDAKETGGDLKIPLAVWADKVINTPHFQALQNDVKFSPDALSLNQIKAEEEETKAALEQEKAAAEQQQQEEARAEQAKKDADTAKEVGAKFAELLEGTGQFDKNYIKNLAKLYEERYRARAEARGLGESPLDLFQAQGLQVESTETPTPVDSATAAQTQESFEQAKILKFKLPPKSEASESETPPYEEQVSDPYKEISEKVFVQKKPISKGDLNKLSLRIDEIEQQIEILDPSNSFESRTIDFLHDELDRLVSILDESLKMTMRKRVRVVGEEGSFDQSQPAPAPPFYLKSIQTVEQKMGGSASPEQINGMLREIKPEERKWSGIDEFLKGKEKVSKDELLQFLRANQLEIKEVVKGENSADFSDQDQARLDELERKAAAGNITLPESTEMRRLAMRATGLSPSTTKFSQYTLPGGENYREVLFTLPPKALTKDQLPSDHRLITGKEFWAEAGRPDANIKKGFEFIVADAEGALAGHGSTEQEALDNYQRVELRGGPDNYRSSHFDEANILAHTRLKDRVDADGKRVLFVEEIQSDWHQEGRKRGYKNDSSKAAAEEFQAYQKKLQDQYGRTFYAEISPEEKAEYDRLAESAANVDDSRSVPDGPFRKTWHEFVLKRLLREAAEKGYDRIAWTTGEQQAERFDLSKSIDRIIVNDNAVAAHPTGGKTGYYVTATDKSGRNVLDRWVADQEQLAEHIGKEAAEKILKPEFKSKKYKTRAVYILENADLKVGGEGMKGFYDKIVPEFLNKFTKKYGGKVGETRLIVDRRQVPTGRTAPEGYEIQETQDVLGKVHSLDITPALRDAALKEGFSLFQGGDKAPRGKIALEGLQAVIHRLKGADRSTILHELGHSWLEEVKRDYATLLSRPQESLDEQQKRFLEDGKTILDWLGVSSFDEIQREHHEKWAEAIEQFFMEGKSSNSKLRKVMARFRVWLVDLYKGLMRSDQLTDEMRGVFDRLLAADEEVDRATAEIPSLDPKAMGMSLKQTEAFVAARGEAQEATKAALTATLMKDLQRAKDQWHRERREEIRKEIDAEVSQLPEFRAVNLLRNGIPVEGAPANIEKDQIKLSREEIKAAFGEEIYKTMPKGVLAKRGEGMPLEAVAELLGFESGNKLITSIAGLPEQSKYVDQLTDQRMKEEHPTMMDSGELPQEAMKALHKQSRAKVLRMELEHLAQHNLPALKNAIRKVARRVPTEKAVRAQAHKIIAGKNVGDLKPHIFLRAEVKAAKEAGEFLAKGDFDQAFLAKRRELLNHELYLAVVEAQEKIEAFREWSKRISKSDEHLAKTRDVDIVYAARAILSQFGLAKSPEAVTAYLEKIKRYDAETAQTVEALIQSATEKAGPYKTVSFDEFVAMEDAVRALWELSKSTREMEVDGMRVDREEAISALANRLDELNSKDIPGLKQAITDKEKLTLGILSLKNLVTRVEHWSHSMDKGELQGAFTKYIVRPILEATTRYRLKKVDTLKDLKALVMGLDKSKGKDKIQAPEIDYTFSKPELLMALLHTGNESNLRKLLLGRKWATENEDGTLNLTKWNAFLQRAYREGLITKTDMDFVQGVWDLNEKLKPDAQKAHKKMFGYYFNEVTAEAINTPFGTYRGGYMPAITDQNLSVDANIRAGQQTMEESPAQMFPTTGRGFTKSRVESYHAPLSLDFTKIQNHLDKVLRFTYIEPAVKDAARLVNNRGFRQKLNAFDPDIGNGLLIPWLKRAATQKSSTPGKKAWLDKGLSWFRRTSSIQFMVLNVVNSMQNMTGFLPASLRTGKANLAGSFGRYITGPKAFVESVVSASPYMRSRVGENMNEVLKDIDEMTMNPTRFQQAKDWAIHKGYILDRTTNGMVEVVVWSAAYDKAISDGMTHEEAVKYGDTTVRQTLVGMNPEDLSDFETGTPFTKLFTMFSGFFNTQQNLLRSELAIAREEGGAKGAARAGSAYLHVVAGPAILSALILKMMAGAGLDEDDDGEYVDDVFDLLFGSQFRYLTAFAPGGNVINTALNRFNNKPFDDKISLSPAVSNLEKAIGAMTSVPKAVAGDGGESKAVKEGLSALGLMTGFPAAPLGKPLGYAVDVSKGKINPTGPVDVARGLVTGKGKK